MGTIPGASCPQKIVEMYTARKNSPLDRCLLTHSFVLCSGDTVQTLMLWPMMFLFVVCFFCLLVLFS